MRVFILILVFGQLMMGRSMAGNLDNTKTFFNQLDKNHIKLVDQFYDRNIVFQDPVHRLNGVASVRNYYSGLYSNVESIHFEYGHGIESGNEISLPWKMFLKSPSIQGGKEVTVEGVSNITFNAEGKAIQHRDYFDMGEFIYERVPILKSVILYIKGKLAGE